MTHHNDAGHIIDWDPAPNATAYAVSDNQLPCNSLTLFGLETLARLASLPGGGNATRGALVGAQAASLRRALHDQMWNSNGEYYCDGICTDPAVNGSGSVWSNMMSLWLGMVPEESRAAVKGAIVANGLEVLGDYGQCGIHDSPSPVCIHDSSPLCVLLLIRGW